MSRLYPEMGKKDERTKVTCMKCQELEGPDKDKVFYCVAKKKIIQDDQLYEPRVCRRFIP